MTTACSHLSPAKLTPSSNAIAAAARGNVTFFQMGSNVNVAVSLESGIAGEASLDLRTGTCKAYAQHSKWPLGSFGGSTQETRLPNTKLENLVGEVLLVHKTHDVGSPVIGCAEIRT